MELMSRVEKRKVEKKKQWDLNWLLGILLFGCILYPFSRLFQFPEDLAYKQMLQTILFFCSILFLNLYVLAFTVASTKTFIQLDEKVSRIKYSILVLWVISILYHFLVWLTSHFQLSPFFYYIGISLTLSVLGLTLIHFVAYFTFVRRDQFAQAKKQSLEYRMQAYESLNKILFIHQSVLEVMERNPEVRQMMKWNEFDRQMGQWVREMENYLKASTFTDQELRNILGVKAWMENLAMIVEQHPLHRGLYKKSN